MGVTVRPLSPAAEQAVAVSLPFLPVQLAPPRQQAVRHFTAADSTTSRQQHHNQLFGAASSPNMPHGNLALL
jgi:hypothetical protein